LVEAVAGFIIGWGHHDEMPAWCGHNHAVADRGRKVEHMLERSYIKDQREPFCQVVGQAGVQVVNPGYTLVFRSVDGNHLLGAEVVE
jgi:hypothetical protein